LPLLPPEESLPLQPIAKRREPRLMKVRVDAVMGDLQVLRDWPVVQNIYGRTTALVRPIWSSFSRKIARIELTVRRD
jgi:hypothetical protein